MMDDLALAGDDCTDDTAALQARIDEAVRSGSGVVNLPPGITRTADPGTRRRRYGGQAVTVPAPKPPEPPPILRTREPCPSCRSLVPWVGVLAPTGGGTVYTIHCGCKAV